MLKIIVFIIISLLPTACSAENLEIITEPIPKLKHTYNKNINLRYFGYAAVACDHDDPFDNSLIKNYIEEVSHFTNFNQICVTEDFDNLTAKLNSIKGKQYPALYIGPVFFKYNLFGGNLFEGHKVLWPLTISAIKNSGIQEEDITFYLTDEPTLKGLSYKEINKAIKIVKETFPKSKIMIIEAYREPKTPFIPSSIDFWGFNAYTIIDPAQDKGYMDYLNKASSILKNHQSIILVMDAQHTPIHKKLDLQKMICLR